MSWAATAPARTPAGAPLTLQALPGDLKNELIKLAEHSQVRASEGASDTSGVSQMGGV